MTASYNISFLGSPEQAESSRASKKNYRSSRYNNAGEREQSSLLELPSGSIKGEANNNMVEILDFDNETTAYEVNVHGEAEASQQATVVRNPRAGTVPCEMRLRLNEDDMTKSRLVIVIE